LHRTFKFNREKEVFNQERLPYIQVIWQTGEEKTKVSKVSSWGVGGGHTSCS